MAANDPIFVDNLTHVLNCLDEIRCTYLQEQNGNSSISSTNPNPQNYFISIIISKEVNRKISMKIEVCSDGSVRIILPEEAKSFINMLGQDLLDFLKIRTIRDTLHANGEVIIIRKEKVQEKFKDILNVFYGLIIMLAV